MKHFCDKCKRYKRTIDMNNSELKECKENKGDFVCSECINREMDEGN